MLKIHPKYLSDTRLLALWREGLNGQRKISKGYPWGDFVMADDPIEGVGAYLSFIASVGLGRGFKINHELILKPNFNEEFLPLTQEQLEKERKQLNLPLSTIPDCNPVYKVLN